MTPVALYGMMQKLLKKFKDTATLLKTLSVDYQMANSDIGRKVVVNPVGTNTRSFRLPLEANMTPGIEAVTLQNADALTNALLWTGDWSKLLAVVKPAGKCSIGFASAGSYAAYDKTNLDTVGFYERLDLTVLSNKSLSANISTCSVKLSQDVMAYAYSAGDGATQYCKVVKWDATNQVYRESANVQPAFDGTGVGGTNSTLSYKIIRMTNTQFVVFVKASYAGAFNYSGITANVFNVTVNADGVDPTISVTSTLLCKSWLSYPTADGTYQGTVTFPPTNGPYEVASVSSTAFYLTVPFGNNANGSASAGQRFYRYTISSNVPSNSHGVDHADTTTNTPTSVKLSSVDGTNAVLVTYNKVSDSSKATAQILDNGTLGTSVALSTVASMPVYAGCMLSATKAVVSYQDSAGPTVRKRKVLTLSGTAITQETATAEYAPSGTTNAYPLTMFPLDATSYIVQGYADFAYPLGTVTGLTLQTNDIVGGDTITLRSEFKAGSNYYFRIAGRLQNVFPRDLAANPKEYYFHGSTDNVRTATANQLVVQRLYEASAVISADATGGPLGGYVQNV